MYISNSLNADPAVNNRRSSVGAPNVHNEVVLVVFDPGVIDFEALPGVFWEAHDPAQGMRQGNDSGIQYRSGIYTFSDEQQTQAEISRGAYQRERGKAGFGAITTEIRPAGPFYYAEGYHQLYLAKNPGGYCGLGGTGVGCREPVQTRLNTDCIRRSRLR